MKPIFFFLFFILFLIVSCESESSDNGNIQTSGTIELKIDQGIIFSTKEIVNQAGGKLTKLDLVVYKYGSSFQIKTGVIPQKMQHKPMHRFLKGGFDQTFASIDEVPVTYPVAEDSDNILNDPKPGVAAIIENLMSNDYTIIFIKQVASDHQSITLDYRIIQAQETNHN